MSVLIIGSISVDNPANLAAYKVAAGTSMQEFGISLVGQSAPTPMLEGKFPGFITVVLEAESEEQARAWHGSESYAKAIAARSPDSTFTIGLVHTVGG
ncbi:MAG: hypothetical protein ACI9K2_004444 [Myxococcota bacterium]|jgi:uncharacterized protein (DUF1330 family)